MISRVRLFLFHGRTELSVFYEPVFKLLKGWSLLRRLHRPIHTQTHEHTHTHMYSYSTHTVHTLWHSLSAEQWWFSPFSYLCSFHTCTHFYWSKTVFPHMDVLAGLSQQTKVETFSLQKFLFCKHYATHFLSMYVFICLMLNWGSLVLHWWAPTLTLFFCVEKMISWRLCCRKVIVTKGPWVSSDVLIIWYVHNST